MAEVSHFLLAHAHYKLSTMYFYLIWSTRYGFLICSTMVTVELGLLSLEKVNSSFFVFSVLVYFDDWSSENKRINTAP